MADASAQDRPPEQTPRARPRWPGTETTPLGATDPEHYAAINAVYAAGLGAVAALARSRERSGADAIPLRELPVLGAAAFALADVLAKQKVTTWLREPFVEESGDHRPVRPEGSGLRYAVGELLTCTRCVGAWCALGLVGLRLSSPAAGRGVSAVLATTGGNHFLQVGFQWLCRRASATSPEGRLLGPDPS